MRIGFHLDRQLLHDLQPVAFQPDNLPRIIRQQPDRLETQVRQNLRPEAVLAQVHVEAQLLVGLHGIVALLLELVGLDLRRQADAPAS